MKARFTFVLLSVAIVALLAVCAWFTMQIFSTDLEGESYVPGRLTPPEDFSIAHDETVTPNTTPVQKAKNARPKPAPAPSMVTAKPQAAPPKSSSLPNYAGKVSQVTGEAYKNKAAGVRAKLSPQSEIFLNDNIETGPESTLIITFVDNTRLSMGEKTACIIDEYVYDPSGESDCSFAMRMVKGVCRIVTGFITDLNPDRFKVETRMATIGIRGCELGFQSKPEEEKIFVVGLGSDEAVVVSSADKGAPVNNMVTGENTGAETTPLIVSNPGTVVIVAKGLGRSTRAMSPGEERQLTTDTSPLKSVKQDATVNPNSTIFVIGPKKKTSRDTDR